MTIFHTVDSDLVRYNRQAVTVIRPLTEADGVDAEVGPMFKVQAIDGTIFEAFADELELA